MISRDCRASPARWRCLVANRAWDAARRAMRALLVAIVPPACYMLPGLGRRFEPPLGEFEEPGSLGLLQCGDARWLPTLAPRCGASQTVPPVSKAMSLTTNVAVAICSGANTMRKIVFLFFLLLGIGAGYLPARNDDWGLRIVMMAVGALFGGAIGGALSRIGRHRPRRRVGRSTEELDPIAGSDMMGRDMAINYWRYKGLPPYSRMPDVEPDKHMFDPDKLN